MTIRLWSSVHVMRLLRAFAFATLATPAIVSGQTFEGRWPSAPTLPARSRPAASDRAASGSPPTAVRVSRWSRRISGDASLAGPLLEPFTTEKAVPAAATYWIASCRRLPQELPYCGVLPLEYFARLPDGSLQPTDVPSLISQLVPGVPVCIFIHGTFVDWEWHQRESAQTFNWVRAPAPHLPLHVIFYTWPSNIGSPWTSPLKVNQLGRWAENSAFYLANLIAQIPPESPVCLVGHSQGGRAVASTLHLLGGGAVGGYVLPYSVGEARRYRAVLAAAAVDRQWLNPGERYDRALCRAEGLLNLHNPADFALHVYPLRAPLYSRQALGDTGFTLWDRVRLGASSCKAIDLNVAPLIGLGHTWPFYHDEPRIAQAIVPYVYFVDQ